LPSFYGDDYYAHVGRRRTRPKQAAWDLLRDVSSGADGRHGGWKLLQPLFERIATWRFDVNVPLDERSQMVIDVGCGFGDLLLYLKSRGCCVQGVELDPAAAETAHEYGVPVHVGDLQDLELPSASVDVGILQHSLEHLAEPNRVLGELARVIRPGGSLHIAVPNGAAAGLAIEKETWAFLSNPVHFWYFDEMTLRKLLRRHDFVVERIRYRTTWVNYWTPSRTQMKSGLPLLACERIGRVLARRLKSAAAGDILRAVATRAAA
jgi:SAM-dependent methyltransferase